jgi:hypothetical protein
MKPEESAVKFKGAHSYTFALLKASEETFDNVVFVVGLDVITNFNRPT